MKQLSDHIFLHVEALVCMFLKSHYLIGLPHILMGSDTDSVAMCYNKWLATLPIHHFSAPQDFRLFLKRCYSNGSSLCPFFSFQAENAIQ